MSVFWSVICAWMGVAFASESAGLFAHEFNNAAAILLLVVSALLYPWQRIRREATEASSIAPEESGQSESATGELAAGASGPVASERGTGSGGWGFVVALIGLVLIPTHWTIRLFAVSLWFWGLCLASRRRGRVGVPLGALAIGCMVFGVYQYLYGNSLLTWYGVQGASEAVSKLGASVVHGFLLGSTFNGIGLVVFALGTYIGAVMISARRRPAWLIGSVIVVATVYIAYFWVFAKTQPNPPDPGVRPPSESTWQDRLSEAVNPLYMTGLLALAMSIPMAVYLRSLGKVAMRSASRVAVPAVLAPVLAVVGIAALLNVPAGERTPAQGANMRCVFYQVGFHNWNTAMPNFYGSRSGGMFGNLPILMKAMGWEGELIPDINAETLAGADILFIANQKDRFDGATIDLIKKFVQDGGSLLLLGDHTWKQDELPGMILDEPIGMTGVHYRFDSAYYFIGGWLHSMQYWPHQTSARLRDETNESGCVVGASLDVSYPATPLVIGRYGYADQGVPKRVERHGYMHNGQADPGERLGDLVLVAAQNVGKGRVVVVGDTSGYVNAIQVQTWPFTTRIFRWLASEGQASVSAWRDVLGILLILGALVTVLLWAASRPGVVVVTCLAVLAAGWGGRWLLQSYKKPEPLRGNIASIDLSHVGMHSLEAWRDNALSGVYMNFMRDGYLPLGCKTFDEDQIRASDVFLTFAPTKPYNDHELDVIEDYMTDGGTVLLDVGWEERAGAQSFLDRFHLRIPHRPEGRAADYVIPGTQVLPNFWAAWPVESTDPQAQPLESLATLRGDPIIVRKQVGRGQLVVIGDTKFFHCQNLETEDAPVMPNIQFFHWLVKNVFQREAA